MSPQLTLLQQWAAKTGNAMAAQLMQVPCRIRSAGGNDYGSVTPVEEVN